MTMTIQPPVSVDAIKLQLVKTTEVAELGTVSLNELIEYLVESLEEADKATANRAEDLLVRIGNPAVPYLVKGLKSNSNAVKSVCAMALVRIGQPAVDAIKELYVRCATRPQHKKHKWVVAFVLTELGEALPALDTVDLEAVELSPVIHASDLIKAG